MASGDYVVGRDIDFQYTPEPPTVDSCIDLPVQTTVPTTGTSDNKKKRKKRKKKNTAAATNSTEQSTIDANGNIDRNEQAQPGRIASGAVANNHPHPSQSPLSQSTNSVNDIWNTSSEEERQRIRDFWTNLSDDERLNLVRLDKKLLLEKVRHQRRDCPCSVCGRKREAVESELEMLYEAYYPELESYSSRLLLGSTDLANDLDYDEDLLFHSFSAKTRAPSQQLDEDSQLCKRHQSDRHSSHSHLHSHPHGHHQHTHPHSHAHPPQQQTPQQQQFYIPVGPGDGPEPCYPYIARPQDVDQGSTVSSQDENESSSGFPATSEQSNPASKLHPMSPPSSLGSGVVTKPAPPVNQAVDSTLHTHPPSTEIESHQVASDDTKTAESNDATDLAEYKPQMPTAANVRDAAREVRQRTEDQLAAAGFKLPQQTAAVVAAVALKESSRRLASALGPNHPFTGGIISMADDILNNEGKRVIDVLGKIDTTVANYDDPQFAAKVYESYLQARGSLDKSEQNKREKLTAAQIQFLLSRDSHALLQYLGVCSLNSSHFKSEGALPAPSSQGPRQNGGDDGPQLSSALDTIAEMSKLREASQTQTNRSPDDLSDIHQLPPLHQLSLQLQKVKQPLQQTLQNLQAEIPLQSPKESPASIAHKLAQHVHSELSRAAADIPENEEDYDEDYDEDDEDYDEDDDVDEYDDEYDDGYDSADPDGDDGLTPEAREEQRVQEGRRMLQVFAARMFEQRIMRAYREHVARERQQRLLQEIEEESRQAEEREAKKLKDKEKKKSKKLAAKKQREEEQRRKEQQEKVRAEAQKVKDEEQRKAQREAERLKAEAHRKEIEARMARMEKENRERRERHEEEQKKQKDQGQTSASLGEQKEKQSAKRNDQTKNVPTPKTEKPKEQEKLASHQTPRKPEITASSKQREMAVPTELATAPVSDYPVEQAYEMDFTNPPVPQSTQDMFSNLGYLQTQTTPVPNHDHYKSSQVKATPTHLQDQFQDIRMGSPSQQRLSPLNGFQSPLFASQNQSLPSLSSNLGLNGLAAGLPTEGFAPNLNSGIPNVLAGTVNGAVGNFGTAGSLSNGLQSNLPGSISKGVNNSMNTGMWGPSYSKSTQQSWGWSPWSQATPLSSPTPPVNHIGGSNPASMWKTSASLEAIRMGAVSSYNRILQEGLAVDGYVPSQVLYHATVDALGGVSFSLNDLYQACGVNSGSGGDFDCLRDSVGLVTHIRHLRT